MRGERSIQVLVTAPNGRTHCVRTPWHADGDAIAADVLSSASYAAGLPEHALSLYTSGGALLSAVDWSAEPVFLSARLNGRLPGGKGGFGSQLRAQKASKKTTNFTACRDLSGRRLRHVKHEKQLKEWYATEAEREAASTSKKDAERREARMKRAREEEAMVQNFAEECKERSEAVHNSVAEGLKNREQKRQCVESSEEIVTSGTSSPTAASGSSTSSVVADKGKGRAVWDTLDEFADDSDDSDGDASSS